MIFFYIIKSENSCIEKSGEKFQVVLYLQKKKSACTKRLYEIKENIRQINCSKNIDKNSVIKDKKLSFIKQY